LPHDGFSSNVGSVENTTVKAGCSYRVPERLT